MTVAQVARKVGRLLKEKERKVVFAESCTGGLVSGALTRVAGISEHHCGGVIVYRDETKTAYLGIAASILQRAGAVSGGVAELMALGVLKMTPEADVAVSVTGHLGPKAPHELDGHVFAAVAWRRQSKGKSSKPTVRFFQCRRGDSRVIRQRWVVEQVLCLLAEELAK